MSIIARKGQESPFGKTDGKNMGEFGDEVVTRLNKIIEPNQGQLILTYREILGGYDGEAGCISQSTPVYTTYFETGFLDGKAKIDLNKSLENCRQINVHGGFTDHHTSFHLYTPDILIPVQNKLELDMLEFSVKDFEKAGSGNIEMGLIEFLLERGDIPGHTENLPYMTTFAVLFGQDEIRNFMKNEISDDIGLAGMAFQRDVDGFLELITTEGGIEKEVKEHYFNEREKLVKNLIQSVATLNPLAGRLKKIEDSVLRLSMYQEFADQDGPEWRWSDYQTHDEYYDLSRQVRSSIKSIESLLEESKKHDFSEHPIVETSHAEISFNVVPLEYIEKVQQEIIPPTKSLLTELGTHVAKARDANLS